MTDAMLNKPADRSVGTTRATPAQAARLMRLATYASTTVALILVVAKLWAWLQTDSVSLLSSLVDSLLDMAASLVTLFAVHHAVQPPDREHRFGHGKAESLAGLGQAILISGSVVFLTLESVHRLIRPEPVESTEAGMIVVVGSVVLTGVLILFQRYIVQRTGSIAINADSLHYRSDLLLNGSVLAGLFLAGRFGWLWADPLFALVVAAIIAHSAWRIVRDAIDVLMDRELPDEERRRIREIATDHAGVAAVHDIRTRSSGTKVFIQLHLEMDGDKPLREVHAIGDKVMHAVEAAFPDAEVLVHHDPAGEEQPPPRFV
jgi:ferrous-iron efflux pump FieF